MLYLRILEKLPMNLYIDTSKLDKLIIKINDKVYESDVRLQKSQLLLPFILEKLKENGFTTRDISEVEINEGPGSYTGLRVGASVSQTIIWGLNLSPLHPIKLNY